MADLTFIQKKRIEELFEMEGGYVLDFSNRTFAEFIGDVTGIDVYYGEGYTDYSSKANKLRQIFQNESNHLVGNLLKEMVNYSIHVKTKNDDLTDHDKLLIDEVLVFADKLLGDDVGVELPKTKEETLQTLLDDIKESLAKNKPSLVLDRLHTFSTKFIRQICEGHGIKVADDKGNFYPIHNLVGLLRKELEKSELIKSEFSLIALRHNTSLFQSFNDIRNDHSYAHDNEVLGEIESEFVVKTMANLLIFIDKIENLRVQEKKEDLDDFDIDTLFS